MQGRESAMRLAFASATADVPVQARTRTYAMVRSALGRKIGVSRPHNGWAVKRGRK